MNQYLVKLGKKRAPDSMKIEFVTNTETKLQLLEAKCTECNKYRKLHAAVSKTQRPYQCL